MRLPLTSILSVAIAVAMTVPMALASEPEPAPDHHHELAVKRQQGSAVVQAVRDATAQFRDVSQIGQYGYVGPVFGCVSSPDEGAMGVHFIDPTRLNDGVIDINHPELLVYEPTRSGRLRLVAAEYLADAATWDSMHSGGEAPYLMGQIFGYSAAPNRFRSGAFYALHVWAWKYNPNGAFSMWNPRVSCADFTG